MDNWLLYIWKKSQKVLSTRSVDGKSIYGWMLASEIEYKTQHKEINVQKIMLTR